MIEAGTSANLLSRCLLVIWIVHVLVYFPFCTP
jgi:hypothetical protein